LISLIRSTKDFWSGLIYIFFGLSAVLIARDYGMGAALKMGAAYFPTLLGSLLIIIGAISVIRGFVIRGAPVGAFAIKGLLMIVGSTLLFGLTVRGAGLAIALPVSVILSAAASSRFRWKPTLLMAVGLTLFCVLVFVKGLGVPLPVVGPWFGG
jgi:putative tricarboxylic transport membrane protein